MISQLLHAGSNICLIFAVLSCKHSDDIYVFNELYKQEMILFGVINIP